ncbi:MAG: disulfide oxidoreductase [Alphaproteobacteria bacterium]|nr:disulfide oxidoreductase [Alphaproteobacteria bacterium]
MSLNHVSPRITAVLGPTNTGKTHFAIERMLGHSSGMIGLPLRLLAREVYEKIAIAKGAHAVALITGEEKIVPKSPTHWVATVESMPLDISTEFLAVDEIQLAADAERGHIFTDRLLHARGRSETVFLGSDTMRPLIQKLVPGVQFIARPRFSDLAYTGPRKLTRLPRRSAIVAFSADAVYSIAELVRRQRGGAAVVMGALSPRTRNAQVALYQSGDVDFMVATDAIGMGLNMDIDHVAFASTEKFDGAVRRPLRPHELAQIAGRAGRHMNDGTFGVTAEAEPFDGETVEAIENHRFDPVRVVQWRNPELNFASIAALDQSLDALPPMRGLARTRAADDHLVLRALAELEDVKAKTQGPAAVKQLWEACQIPDFRKVSVEEHARLVGNIYEHLTSHDGVLPDEWIDGHVSRLDASDGDMDAIAQRIANIRIWTYVSNRPGWLKDSAHWQERTRAIEDKLSDALHERLTQRFVDRRTSVLMRRLREDEEFAATIDDAGEVLVDGEFVGKLQGFSFVPDPRAIGVHGRALRAAALKGLSGEIAARAHALSNAPEAAVTLSEHGRLWWNGAIVAKLAKGADPLRPRVELMADDILSPTAQERARERLEEWVAHHIAKHLAPLLALQTELKEEPIEPQEPAPAATPEAASAEPTTEEKTDTETEAADTADEPAVEPEGGDAAPAEEATSTTTAEPAAVTKQPLKGMARGLAFRLYENLGSVPRIAIVRDLRAIDQAERAPLRRLGVRFGAFSVFLPALVKPAAARLKALLWAVHQGIVDVPPPPPAGLTSIAADAAIAAGFYEAAGFRVCGARAVRVDMLERLGELIRSKGANKQMPETFSTSPDMMSILGCGEEDLTLILRAIGFRDTREKAEDGTETVVWKQRNRREERELHGRGERKPFRKHKAEARPHGEGTRPEGEREAKGPREKGHRKDQRPRRGKHERDEQRQERKGEQRPERREKPSKIDPDSPFAALAALKFRK